MRKEIVIMSKSFILFVVCYLYKSLNRDKYDSLIWSDFSDFCNYYIQSKYPPDFSFFVNYVFQKARMSRPKSFKFYMNFYRYLIKVDKILNMC